MEMTPKKMLALSTALFLFGVAATVDAGQRTVRPVVIDDSGRQAGGSFVDARGSNDRSQALGCFVNEAIGFCWAVDENNIFRSCSIIQPKQLELVRSLKSETILAFRWSPEGFCENVTVYYMSSLVPASNAGY
jgi:hypothetical protein